MTTTTTTTAPTTTPAPKAFPDLPCILCGCLDCVSVRLYDLDFHCSECGDTFGVGDVRAHVARWTRVVAWVETCPGGGE